MDGCGYLPNELPRDASRYFGEQLLKHIFNALVGEGSEVITRATMVNKGKLTKEFEYLRNTLQKKYLGNMRREPGGSLSA